MDKNFMTHVANRYSYTDMADELDITRDTLSSQGIKTSRIVLDSKMAEKWGKPKGTYVTVEADTVMEDNHYEFGDLSRALSIALNSLGSFDNCLVVGLGNQYLIADALGTKATKSLLITRHLKESSGVGCLSAVCPSVLGITGIESGDIIKGIVDKTRPSCIIVIDSLASATLGRIATAFQVSDAGITPGSGVGNNRLTLNRMTLGVPVYSIGVPLVVYASTIIRDFIKQDIDLDDMKDMVVTPKDIDSLVEDCAKIIATAINLSVHKIQIKDLREMGLC